LDQSVLDADCVFSRRNHPGTTGGEKVVLVNSKTGDTIRELHGRFRWINHIAYSPDGRLVAASGKDLPETPSLRVWAAENGRLLLETTKRNDASSSLAFSPSGKLLVSGNQDSTILLWKVR